MKTSIDGTSVIRRAFGIYINQALVLLPAASVVFILTGILSTILREVGPGFVLLAQLIALVATSLVTGMVVGLVSDIQDGQRDASVGQLLRTAAAVLWQLVVVGLVAAVLEGLGLLLLIVPGLLLITTWSVFDPVIVLERPAGGLQALARSRELVHGNSWPVFGVIVVVFILVGVIGAGFILAGEAAGKDVGLVVRVLVGILGVPLVALVKAVLYFDLLGIHARLDAESPDLSGPFQSGPFPSATP